MVTDRIVHELDLTDRARRILKVGVRIPASLVEDGILVLPTWTPGSYVTRDHVRHLRGIAAADEAGRPIPLVPRGVSRWGLPRGLGTSLHVRLDLFADERTVRTNHIDDRHGLIVGAATFLCLLGARDLPQRVQVRGVGAGSTVHSTLAPLGENSFEADDYDALADAAFEVGAHPTVSRDIDGRTHRIVWAGGGATPDLDALMDDLSAIAHAASDLLGPPPLPHGYTVLAIDAEPGGLEHRDGTTIALPRHDAEDPSTRIRTASLLAHEYLHLWNGRRLSPRDLVRPALDEPNPTPSLWMTEGWTSYYDLLLPARSGIASAHDVLERLGRRIQYVHERPGVRRQSLRDASWAAWTKHYRAGPDTPNTSTDYYVHGSIVALELDLLLREERPAGSGLDDVLRLMWSRHGDGSGFTEAHILAAIEAIGGHDIAEHAERSVGTATAPDPIPLLERFGVVGRWATGRRPDLGIVFARGGDRRRVETVLEGGCAWTAGVLPGDELHGVEDAHGTRSSTSDPLEGVRAGVPLTLEVGRDGRTLEIRTEAVPAERHLTLDLLETASTAALALRWDWLGT